jgi:hypothetical protein
MQVTITKKPDGTAILKVVRDDGSEDWQKQRGSSGAFFPLHDLTHYSVETELGITDAFFGLVARGWSIEDTTGKGSRGALPINAIFVEHVVGTLDSERASLTRWPASDFNETIARSFANAGLTVPRTLTEDEVLRIRKRRAELFQAWNDTPPGRTLSLTFP